MATTSITNWRIWSCAIPPVTVRVIMRPIATPVCRVPYGALVMLERSAGKLARSVLRGLGGCKPTWLPGGISIFLVLSQVAYYLISRYSDCMHVISRKTLRQFWAQHPDSENACARWFKIMQQHD